MRAIAKGKEPKKLAEYRCKPDAVYDGPKFSEVKDSIRKQLLQEQGYLCAYCMTRIDSGFDQIKVEHWHCQDKYTSEQLDYQNMLAVCHGNEGQPPEKQTCDTRKGNADIKYNPSNPNHRIEKQIHFLGDGRIRSDDSEFDRQLNEFLNLNYPRLVQNRKAVLDAVHFRLSAKSGIRTVAEIDKLLSQYSRPDTEGRLQAYCAIAVYYLRKRHAKVAKIA